MESTVPSLLPLYPFKCSACGLHRAPCLLPKASRALQTNTAACGHQSVGTRHGWTQGHVQAWATAKLQRVSLDGDTSSFAGTQVGQRYFFHRSLSSAEVSLFRATLPFAIRKMRPQVSSGSCTEEAQLSLSNPG